MFYILESSLMSECLTREVTGLTEKWKNVDVNFVFYCIVSYHVTGVISLEAPSHYKTNMA